MVTATDPCPECRGSGREVEIEEVLDDAGLEVIAEIPRDYGPCEICDGRGSFPAETSEQQEAREARERDERIRHHVATARVHGYAHCGWGCPIADELRREHYAPGGDHDTLCVDRCIGY